MNEKQVAALKWTALVTALLAIFAESQVEYGEATYSGSGDDGEITEVGLYFAEDPQGTDEQSVLVREITVQLPEAKYAQGRWTHALVTTTRSVEQALEDLANIAIDRHGHGGYENGDGGCGTFTLYANGRYDLAHSDYVVETIDYRDEGPAALAFLPVGVPYLEGLLARADGLSEEVPSVLQDADAHEWQQGYSAGGWLPALGDTLTQAHAAFTAECDPDQADALVASSLATSGVPSALALAVRRVVQQWFAPPEDGSAQQDWTAEALLKALTVTVARSEVPSCLVESKRLTEIRAALRALGWSIEERGGIAERGEFSLRLSHSNGGTVGMAACHTALKCSESFVDDGRQPVEGFVQDVHARFKALVQAAQGETVPA